MLKDPRILRVRQEAYKGHFEALVHDQIENQQKKNHRLESGLYNI